MNFREDLLSYLRGYSYNVVKANFEDNKYWCYVDIDVTGVNFRTMKDMQKIAKKHGYELNEITINTIDKEDGLFTIWFNKLKY